MKKVNNSNFLKFFEEKDLIKYYYDCMNIENAGQSKTAVKSMEYFTSDGLPSESFVSLCENVFEEIIIEINTDDTTLIKDVLSYVKSIAKNYKKIRIGALHPDFYNSDILKKYFKVLKTYNENYGVYAQYSKDEVPETKIPDNAYIDLVSNEEKEKFLSFDDDQWDGLSSIVEFSMQDDNDKEIFFIIKENDTICGYIIGDCAAKNVYDIGNVFVHEKYRGKGYGKLLTVAFSNECYKRNGIPHYGTAVSKYSEAVAVKSGFTEVGRHYYADVKVKLFPLFKKKNIAIKTDNPVIDFYKNTPVLETERLILRPMTVDDAQAAFIWCSDKRVNKFMPYNLYTDVSECVHWITEIIPQDEVDYNWGIVLKENNLLIGSCSIGKNELEPDAWGFGYNIRYDYWNKGITTEATMKMIEYAHKVHGIKTFVSNHAVDNPASGRVMEKCGLKFDHYGEYKTFDGKQTFKAKFYKLVLE